FWDQRASLEFYRAGSRGAVERLMIEMREAGLLARCFGIVDRDFRTDDEVAAAWAELPRSHLFVLVRYAIENYVLEPQAVYEELRCYHGRECPIPDVEAMGRELHTLCRRLRRVMAAHWVLLEAGGEFFAIGDDRILDERGVVEEVARRLGCDED